MHVPEQVVLRCTTEGGKERPNWKQHISINGATEPPVITWYRIAAISGQHVTLVHFSLSLTYPWITVDSAQFQSQIHHQLRAILLCVHHASIPVSVTSQRIATSLLFLPSLLLTACNFCYVSFFYYFLIIFIFYLFILGGT